MGVHGSEVALIWVAALSFTLLVALGLYDRGRHLRNDARSGGVDADHLDGVGPPPGLLGHPSAQVGGVSAVEHVDDLAGGRGDRGGDEPPSPATGGRGHDGLRAHLHQ